VISVTFGVSMWTSLCTFDTARPVTTTTAAATKRFRCAHERCRFAVLEQQPARAGGGLGVERGHVGGKRARARRTVRFEEGHACVSPVDPIMAVTLRPVAGSSHHQR
jgi:hypothetical protein